MQLVAALFLLLLPLLSVQASPQDPVTINQDGATLTGSNNIPLALREYEQALKVDRNFGPALERLAETYIRYGNSLQSFPAEALKQFHRAYYFNNADPETVALINKSVQRLGLNPNSFEDRRSLGEAAFNRGDFIDCVIELKIALRIKDDADVSKKLEAAQNRLSGTLYGEKLKDIAVGAQNTLNKVNEIDYGPYMNNLKKQITAHWKPPVQPSTKYCKVLFKVEKNGTLKDLKLTESSGTSIVDISALKAVSEAAPFPSLPDGSANTVDIQFTFDYNVFGSPRNFGTTATSPWSSHRTAYQGAAVIPSLAR